MTASETNSAGVKKLTKRRKDTGELYTRRPDAERQIGEVLRLEPAQILELLTNWQREADGFLLDETIVYLLRVPDIDNDFREDLYLELNRRIWNLLLKFRKNFKDQSDFEDFGQKTELAILRKLLDTDSDRADFAQVQFGSFVVSEAKSVWKQNLAAIGKDKEFLNAPREDIEETGANELENLAADGLSEEGKMIITEGLKKLSTEHQRVAAMLLDGFQIESKDENELTISKHLGVSSRTIRNWVKEMRLTLADYKGESKR